MSEKEREKKAREREANFLFPREEKGLKDYKSLHIFAMHRIFFSVEVTTTQTLFGLSSGREAMIFAACSDDDARKTGCISIFRFPFLWHAFMEMSI